MISLVENLDRGQLGGADLVEGGDTLQIRHLKKGGDRTVIANDGGSPTQGRNLGVGACGPTPEGWGGGRSGQSRAPAASRARGFNPGHAPHHRGIGVTPPGLGREKPWGIWGAGTRCRSELLPTPTHKRRLRGSGGNAFGSSRRPAPFPSQGVGGGFSANGRSVQNAAPTVRSFLPKFTNVAGGFQLSHAMHWPDTFAQNSERTARRVPSVADVTDVGPIPGGRVPRTGFAILGMVDREPRGRLLELTNQRAGTP